MGVKILYNAILNRNIMNKVITMDAQVSCSECMFMSFVRAFFSLNFSSCYSFSPSPNSSGSFEWLIWNAAHLHQKSIVEKYKNGFVTPEKWYNCLECVFIFCFALLRKTIVSIHTGRFVINSHSPKVICGLSHVVCTERRKTYTPQ